MTLIRLIWPGLAQPREDHPEPVRLSPSPMWMDAPPRGMEGDPCGSGPINDAATRRDAP